MTSEWFNLCSTVLVVVNMGLMCLAYDTMSGEYAAQLERGSTIITWLFIGEMGLKLLGLGCVGYWSDGWNQLDGTIVLISIVDLLMTYLISSSGVKLSFLRILRMLRVVRV